MTQQKSKRVFISYAHKDGLEFVRRLAFALGMYMDVFWDRRLRTGTFDTQLYSKIEACDYFLLVMTPSSLREDGWCRRELEHAEKHNIGGIVLAKLYDECGFPDFEQNLNSKYTYGDFGTDFDAGFRRITQMMLGSPLSSWEYLSMVDDSELIINLGQGRLPAVISKSVAEWVIIEKVWRMVEGYNASLNSGIISIGQPRTPKGVIQQSELLLEQFEQINNVIGFQLSEQVKNLATIYFSEISPLTDDAHSKIGKSEHKLIQDAYELILERHERDNSVRAFSGTQAYFNFDVAEKIREEIHIHSRRSRFLY
jgi:hypothetical protein